MVINSLLIYDYVGGREGVNPDPYKVRTSSICSLVLGPQVGYLWIYTPLQWVLWAKRRRKTKLKCNQPKAVKGNLSDLPLGEVVDWDMVLGATVAKVVRERWPEVPELALSISAMEPVKLHVHWLCFAGDGCFIGESNCSGVFALDRRSWLRPSHFNEWLAEWYHLLWADVETCQFSFSRRRY